VRILLTGTTGFVGTALLGRLLGDGRWAVRAALRRETDPLPAAAERVQVTDLAPDTPWATALDGVDTVVHLAARVHVMHDQAGDPLADFRRVNVAGTQQLARQAAAAGVRRFVYLSSIKVNGEETLPGRPFEPDDPAHPMDPYGISKHEAELGLRELESDTGMQVVVVRPPLVYGPGVKANFRALMQAVARGVPLPLGAIDNRRSLVALDNLVDFIVACVEHPAAAGQTFLVSDGVDLSTPNLVRHIAHAMHRPARLVPVPMGLLGALAALTGKRAAMHRLCSSLEVDISKSRRLLGWAPPLSLDEAFDRAVQALCRVRTA
jgi:nucleoside-diphosphate-sugar epimerase